MAYRRLLTAAAVLLCGKAIADEAPAPVAFAAAVKVGDEWDYKMSSNLANASSGVKTFVVQDVSAGRIESEVHLHRTTGGGDVTSIITFDPTWRMLESPSGKVVNRDDSAVMLAPGKEWTREISYQPNHSSLRFKWSERAHVAACENLKLANGRSFDTFRIVYRRENAPQEGSGFQVVQAGMAAHHVVERETIWYAPAVNRYVKRTFESASDGTVTQSFTEELTSYKPGA